MILVYVTLNRSWHGVGGPCSSGSVWLEALRLLEYQACIMWQHVLCSANFYFQGKRILPVPQINLFFGS